jgi:hypothetical protein
MAPMEVLTAFWVAMCEWERRAFRTLKTADRTALDVARLQAERAMIVSEFCTPKRRAYSEPLSCGDPTMYDPDTEEVLEAVSDSPRRIVIHTLQRTGFKDRRKYILLRRGDWWLLDNWQSLSAGKWRRGII